MSQMLQEVAWQQPPREISCRGGCCALPSQTLQLCAGGDVQLPRHRLSKGLSAPEGLQRLSQSLCCCTGHRVCAMEISAGDNDTKLGMAPIANFTEFNACYQQQK